MQGSNRCLLSSLLPDLSPFFLGIGPHFWQLILTGTFEAASLTPEMDLIKVLLLPGQSDQFRDRYMAQAREIGVFRGIVNLSY